MQNDNQAAIREMLKSFAYLLDEALKKTTKTYEGIVLSPTSDSRKWNVRYNNEIHAVKLYGSGIPTVNMMVKVIIPQGNQALAWFFVPGSGGGGTGDGATFIPSVSEEGIISWTNDGGLPNPTPVNIKGPQGDAGPIGDTGPQGSAGPYFTPSVDSSGDLSWTNNGGLVNPSTVNIKGPQGAQGIQGIQGEQGETGAQGPQGLQGDPGYYFTPSVSNTGDLSWTNNGNLENPTTVNIKGPQGAQGVQGIQGEQGPQGEKGEVGYYFTPNVDESGNLSWSNNGNLNNPSTVNIKGPQGEQGTQGIQGQVGPQGETGPYFTPSVDSNGDLSWTNNGGLDNPAIVNIQGPQGQKGETGEAGSYFIPSVSSSGDLSWTNTGGLQNPSTVNIKGPQGPIGEIGPEGPQGEQGIPGEQGVPGEKGDTGPYFTPSVSSEGIISWTNNGGLVNPETINIKGPQGPIGPQGEKGEQGEQGVQGIPGEAATIQIGTVTSGDTPSVINSGTSQAAVFDFVLQQGPKGEQGVQGPEGPAGPQGVQGEQGATGPYFTPSVDSSGNLSWINNGGLVNPSPVNIRGPQGIQGETGATGPQGAAGAAGADATINGVNALTINATGGLTSSQSGSIFTIDGSSLQSNSLFNTIFNGVLPTTGWTLNNNIYYNQITVPNMTADQIPLIFPQWTANQTNEEIAWNSIKPTVQTFNGYIWFYSNAPITTSVSFALCYKV